MRDEHGGAAGTMKGARAFAATRWSVVIAAGRHDDDSRARVALETLCRAYWYPLYAFVRREGYGAEEARDLTQEFFARLIARRDLRGVDRVKGKFRSFLLASMKHFLSNARDKARARKRGGGAVVISLDACSAEERYALEPAHAMTADLIYDRRWALTLLDEVLGALRREYAAIGKQALFEALADTLTGDKPAQGYAAIGARLGLSEGAVKVTVHRLRRRYRELLRAAIADTVANPDDVDRELRHLLAAVSSGR